MDTSGKGGTVKHVVGQVDPAGVHVTAFRAPTPEERRRDFLWRIRQRLPEPGMLGVFDRSHYEDVVAVRVRGIANRATWTRRSRVHQPLRSAARGAGHRDRQVLPPHLPRRAARAASARLEDPTKQWKFRPGMSTTARCGPGHERRVGVDEVEDFWRPSHVLRYDDEAVWSEERLHTTISTNSRERRCDRRRPDRAHRRQPVGKGLESR